MFRRLSATFLASTLLALAVFVDADASSAVELRAAAPAASFGRGPTSDLATLPTAAPWQAGAPIRQVPRRNSTRVVTRAEGSIGLRAPVAPSGPSLLHPLWVKAGQSFTGAVPPDTVGAVGRSYFIQAVNAFGLASSGAQITIWNKNGQRLAGPIFMSSLWPNPSDSCAQGGGDGVVVYDAVANRFIISEFPAFGDFLCVYVAKTSNPVQGGFYAYQFQTQSFPDYAKFAVWRNMYVVTTNEFQPTVYALDRSAMLQGRLARFQAFSVDALPGLGFQSLTPATFTGTIPPPVSALPIVARHRDNEINGGQAPTGKDLIELWQVAVNFGSPASSALLPLPPVPVADFDSDLCGGGSFNCIRQKGTTQRLDAIPNVLMWPLQYRRLASREVLVGTLTTNVSTGDRSRPLLVRAAADHGWLVRASIGRLCARQQPEPVDGLDRDRSSGQPGDRILRLVQHGLSLDPRHWQAEWRPAGNTTSGSGATGQPCTQVNSDGRWGDYAAMTVDPVTIAHSGSRRSSSESTTFGGRSLPPIDFPLATNGTRSPRLSTLSFRSARLRRRFARRIELP